ncbi:hypothetical protein [Phycicoccus sp. Soil803]|uniref:hypothetical protein n=1 Tax=Phycicoccus sp. Soil803 TaxID=1736415 RepID=UPI00070AA629|nr:hypothetical protein [Phycicoccus sp. Soil803]KRF23229.1 hypothetical protein ASG95_00430 [Phycicoccus sp. Soil803]
MHSASTETPGNDSPGPATDRRRPRITHLVLVDGLPADHWVEESADVAPPVPPRAGSGRARRTAALITAAEQRDAELRWLEALVGGRAALLALDDAPLEPRPITVPDLGPELNARARAVAAECDRLAVEVFDDEELGTALRRLWEAVLVTDPGMLARSSRDDTAVGALVWAGAQANGLLGREGRLLARDLWPRLGVPASAAGRGGVLLDRLAPAADLPVAPPGAPRLRPTGRPEVLLAHTRALLVARRDEFWPRPGSNPMKPV